MIPQFVNPLMLWGLAAASVPIVIHLLNRRRFRTQRWAAMEWLLAAVRKNQKRLRMENLLLLLLRTCAVLLLALALARPTFSDARLSIDKQATHLYLLLDDSASMGARTGAGTVFEKAAGDALTLVSQIGTDDPVTLVVTNDEGEEGSRRSGRPRVVLRGTHDHANVRRLLGDLKPVAARADLVESLKLLEESVPMQAGVAAKVAILTDLQRASFEESGERGAASADAAVRASLTRLREKGAEVVLIPPGRAAPNNVAITSLAAQDDRDVVQGATVVFQADVRNFGDVETTAEVRFLVDGKERGAVSQKVVLKSRPVGADAPPAQTVQYVATFPEPADVGVHVLEARVATDALAIDDVRTFAFEVRKPLRVLAVDEGPLAQGQRETYFLKPTLAIKEDGPVVVQQVSEEEYEGEVDLAKWDLVVLANVEHPARTDAVRRRLESFLRGGGAVLLSVGDRVVPDVWNAELFRDAEPILPARLAEPRVVARAMRAISGFKFHLGENRHPIFVDITNPNMPSIFSSPIVWGRMDLRDAAKTPGARVVANYADLAGTRKLEQEALVERSFGRGRVLLLTTTVDDAWTDLPGNILFPPLLHEALYHLTARGNSERNLLTFQSYTRTLPTNVDVVELTRPEGALAPVTPERSDPSQPPYVPPVDTPTPGAYRLTIALKPADILAAAPPPLRDAFAVNMTPVESDLARLSTADVESRWPGLVRVSPGFAAAAEMARPRGGEFHAALIIAAIACLLGEALLVRRIARTRTAAA
jgi:hypothetical protein